MKKSYLFRLTLVLIAMMLSNLMPLNADCNCNKAALDTIASDNHEDPNIIFCGKKYIPIEKIAFIDKTILVEIEDRVFETPAIYNDEDGYYINDLRGDCGHIQWKCAHCGTCNLLLYSCCSECDWHISGKRRCN